MKYDPEFLENYWMPFTSNRDFKADPRIVVRSEGVYMYNDAEERSSGWVLRAFLLRCGPQPARDRTGGA